MLPIECEEHRKKLTTMHRIGGLGRVKLTDEILYRRQTSTKIIAKNSSFGYIKNITLKHKFMCEVWKR